MDLIKATLDASTQGVKQTKNVNSMDDLNETELLEYHQYLAEKEMQTYKQLKQKIRRI